MKKLFARWCLVYLYMVCAVCGLLYPSLQFAVFAYWTNFCFKSKILLSTPAESEASQLGWGGPVLILLPYHDGVQESHCVCVHAACDGEDFGVRVRGRAGVDVLHEEDYDRDVQPEVE